MHYEYLCKEPLFHSLPLLNLAHKTDVRLPRESVDRFLAITLWLQQLLRVGGARFVIRGLDGPSRKNGSVVNPRTILTMADWFFTVFQRASGLQRPNLHRSPVVGLSTAELPD
jgi:hypothetical protein